MKRRIIIAVTALLAVFGVAFGGAYAASAATGVDLIQEKLVVKDPGSDTGNQILVEDKNGAPMFWVNMFGATSGAEPVCVLSLQLKPEACVGGPYGNYGGRPTITLYNMSNGRGYSLTPQDITWIHAHGG